MKITRWSFHNLHMPMIEADDGTLYCTTKQLADALGVTEVHVREIKRLHKDELDTVRVNEIGAKDFLLRNKAEFRIERVKSDMNLFTEDDMIGIAMIARSTVSKAFRKELIKFVKENAKRDMVPMSVHEAAMQRLDNLEAIVLGHVSQAGKTLNEYKSVKHLQLVH